MMMHQRLRVLAEKLGWEDRALVLAAADALEPNELPVTYWGKISGPLHALKVGQSHLFLGRTTRDMHANIWHVSRKTGHKFRSRTVTGGCRVWRTS